MAPLIFLTLNDARGSYEDGGTSPTPKRDYRSLYNVIGLLKEQNTDVKEGKETTIKIKSVIGL